jgi:Ribbon-helix-helix protein, copG family
MNARTQITLDPEMQRRAQEKAAELGISFAEYVRRAIAKELGEPQPKPDISVLFDLGASDEPTNIARDKDKMIGEALWKEYQRKTAHMPEDKAKRGPNRR